MLTFLPRLGDNRSARLRLPLSWGHVIRGCYPLHQQLFGLQVQRPTSWEHLDRLSVESGSSHRGRPYACGSEVQWLLQKFPLLDLHVRLNHHLDQDFVHIIVDCSFRPCRGPPRVQRFQSSHNRHRNDHVANVQSLSFLERLESLC